MSNKYRASKGCIRKTRKMTRMLKRYSRSQIGSGLKIPPFVIPEDPDEIIERFGMETYSSKEGGERMHRINYRNLNFLDKTYHRNGFTPREIIIIEPKARLFYSHALEINRNLNGIYQESVPVNRKRIKITVNKDGLVRKVSK